MNDHSINSKLSLIASQIEAASNLLKFASDDLSEILNDKSSIFFRDLEELVKGLQMQSAVLDGHAAFILRTDLVGDDESDSGGEASEQWIA